MSPDAEQGDFYDLVPSASATLPRLTGGVVHRPDHDTLIDALLAELSIHARNCIRAFGDFQFAVSATEEVEPFLRRLMYDLNHREFPWARTRVWSVDEVLASDEEDTRAARLRGLILDQSGLPPEQFHALRLTAPVSEGIAAYEAELRQHLGWREKGHDRLDFALLTLSPTGGVAGFEWLEEAPPADDTRLVHEVNQQASACGDDGSVPRRPVPCVSMSMAFLNASRMIAVIAAGESRRAAVARMAEAVRRRRRELAAPALYLSPMAGELRFYLDNAACPTP
ncbi:MAG TPA: 6-phosphogluconolactonase [Phycisphaerales bacterium]|nr:6-phosphogluconolactonase [Phycisphaerales bacterium]